MKKLVVIVLAVVVLVAGGLGGFAYAQGNGHEPMKGQKLIGTGGLGMFSDPEDDYQWINRAIFELVNPDCVAEITIERVFIIRDDGEVIYEGPGFDYDPGTGDRIDWDETMEPHEIRVILLWYYMRDEYGNWLTEDQAYQLTPHSYTVEVFWDGKKKGLPLLGWAYGNTFGYQRIDGEKQWSYSQEGNQMVNMKQKLKPKD